MDEIITFIDGSKLISIGEDYFLDDIRVDTYEQIINALGVDDES